jgi:hypothetical protein
MILVVPLSMMFQGKPSFLGVFTASKGFFPSNFAIVTALGPGSFHGVFPRDIIDSPKYMYRKKTLYNKIKNKIANNDFRYF